MYQDLLHPLQCPICTQPSPGSASKFPEVMIIQICGSLFLRKHSTLSSRSSSCLHGDQAREEANGEGVVIRKTLLSSWSMLFILLADGNGDQLSGKLGDCPSKSGCVKLSVFAVNEFLTAVCFVKFERA